MPPASARPSLTDVVVAFDIDNTLLDATGESYVQTTRDFLSIVELDAPLEARIDAYEWVRAHGRVLEAMGFANPRHERDHPDGLALLVLMLGGCAGSDSACTAEATDGWRSCMVELDRLQRVSQTFPPSEEAFSARTELNRRCASDPAVAVLRRAIGQLAQTPFIKKWSARYASLEAREHVPDVRPLMDSLRSRGAIPVIISEGRREIQLGKLERLSLLETMHQQTLITEAATDIDGLDDLDDAIAERVAGQVQGDAAELELLVWYRNLIRQWGTKSPAFFGRCLHAVRASVMAPARSLVDLTMVDAQTWSSRPMRFVMVGDRYDKDVAPLIDLLGENVGMTLRLQYGKYADRDPVDTLPPDRRPTRTFGAWEELDTYLSSELRSDDIPPIVPPPSVLPAGALGTHFLTAGRTHDLNAIRQVACLV